MVSVIGQPVERNDELFSLIPAHGSTLTRGDIWRGARLQRIRRYGDIDGVGEYIGALLSLANAQARAGNVAGAERVRSPFWSYFGCTCAAFDRRVRCMTPRNK